MKSNKTKLYATALAEILMKPASDKSSAWQGKVIANFVALLTKENLLGKADEILNLAESIILKKKGNKKIVFETARKMTQKQRESFESFVKKGDAVEEKINPALIAGAKIVIDGSRQLDSSLSNKLQNIF